MCFIHCWEQEFQTKANFFNQRDKFFDLLLHPNKYNSIRQTWPGSPIEHLDVWNHQFRYHPVVVDASGYLLEIYNAL